MACSPALCRPPLSFSTMKERMNATSDAGGETEVSVSENCGQDLKMVGPSLKLLCSCLTELRQTR